MIDKKSIKQKKYSNPYKVRTNSSSTKDVDLSSRTVKGAFNGYYYIDSDLDMLIEGAGAKSINERGPKSTSPNKIKHLKDHSWRDNIARIDYLAEEKFTYNGQEMFGLVHESYYPESTDSNDMLIKIQEKVYDNRSIGFRYVSLQLAEKESDNEEERKAWEQYYPRAVNPEVADKHGFFWVVPEIKLHEGSDVTFGANVLTPTLGIKSIDIITVKTQILEKLDNVASLFRNGKLSDEGFHKLEMEQDQLKQYIHTLSELKEPSIKDTLKPSIKDTKSNDKDELYNQIIF